MQPIADALVRASLSAETRSRRPAAVAFVRESLMRQEPEGYARTCEALAEMGPADTSRIDCPTLLVTGDEDAVAPPQAVRMMGERIAGSRVEVLRGCGHWAPVEKPEECTALLQRCLLERRPTWRTSSSRTSGSSTPPALSPTRARF
jgi:pimeloyl-ACP methyl ester carboxylesterase